MKTRYIRVKAPHPNPSRWEGVSGISLLRLYDYYVALYLSHLVIASDRRERRNRIVMATNATTLRLLRRMLRILLVMTRLCCRASGTP